MDESRQPSQESREPEKPEKSHNWRKKLRTREEMLKYLQTAERYWFSQEWYGSESRKTPA